MEKLRASALGRPHITNVLTRSTAFFTDWIDRFSSATGSSRTRGSPSSIDDQTCRSPRICPITVFEA